MSLLQVGAKLTYLKSFWEPRGLADLVMPFRLSVTANESAMIDIKALRHNPEAFIKTVQARGNKVDLGPLLALDAKRRELIVGLDQLKAQRNENSQKVGKGGLSEQEKQALIDLTRTLGDQIKAQDPILRDLEERLEQAALVV